ncbi:MAG: hypothetical protein MMC23_005150 [Stictis urceolatum]|nr:hypothetical protein [Stictis urceolata]
MGCQESFVTLPGYSELSKIADQGNAEGHTFCPPGLSEQRPSRSVLGQTRAQVEQFWSPADSSSRSSPQISNVAVAYGSRRPSLASYSDSTDSSSSSNAGWTPLTPETESSSATVICDSSLASLSIVSAKQPPITPSNHSRTKRQRTDDDSQPPEEACQVHFGYARTISLEPIRGPCKKQTHSQSEKRRRNLQSGCVCLLSLNIPPWIKPESKASKSVTNKDKPAKVVGMERALLLRGATERTLDNFVAEGIVSQSKVDETMQQSCSEIAPEIGRRIDGFETNPEESTRLNEELHQEYEDQGYISRGKRGVVKAILKRRRAAAKF